MCRAVLSAKQGSNRRLTRCCIENWLKQSARDEPIANVLGQRPAQPLGRASAGVPRRARGHRQSGHSPFYATLLSSCSANRCTYYEQEPPPGGLTSRPHDGLYRRVFQESSPLRTFSLLLTDPCRPTICLYKMLGASNGSPVAALWQRARPITKTHVANKCRWDVSGTNRCRWAPSFCPVVPAFAQMRRVIYGRHGPQVISHMDGCKSRVSRPSCSCVFPPSRPSACGCRSKGAEAGRFQILRRLAVRPKQLTAAVWL